MLCHSPTIDWGVPKAESWSNQDTWEGYAWNPLYGDDWTDGAGSNRIWKGWHRNDRDLQHTFHRKTDDTSAIVFRHPCRDPLHGPASHIQVQTLPGRDTPQNGHRTCSRLALSYQTECRARTRESTHALHEACLLFGASFFSDGDVEHFFCNINHRVISMCTELFTFELALKTGDLTFKSRNLIGRFN